MLKGICNIFWGCNNKELLLELEKIQNKEKESTEKIEKYASIIINQNKTITEKNNTFEAIMATVPAMIWFKDVKGRYLSVNKKILDELFYGMSEIEIIGKTDVEIAKIIRAKHGEESFTMGEVCGDSDKVVLEQKKPVIFYEYGNINYVLTRIIVHKNVVRDETGDIVGTTGYGYQITSDYRQLENIANLSNIESMRKEIKRYLTKDLFVSNMLCEV